MARIRGDRQAPTYRLTVEHGTGYEALLGLSMFTGDEAESSYEAGRAWFARARQAASKRLEASVRKLLGRDGQRWFKLLGLAHEAGPGHSVDDLLGRLDQLPATEVHRALSGGRLPAGRREDKDLASVRRMARLGASGVKQLTVDIVERWSREVMTRLGSNAAVLEADAAAKRQLERRTSGPRLIELATGGIVYPGEAGIDQVVLVPSVVTRPWVSTSEWDSAKIICYPAESAADASGGSDRRLAEIYRALGDETRLRLLRELSAGDRRLTELAEALGLAKSTIHEHLGALRSAGLIRVNLGAEKRYGLRPGLVDLNRLLKEYLAPR
ncbi:MAG TPA: metalloregulator ArsR/SmtB family transcription factor [Candidatus Dormibacteraeota bacterium]